MSVTYNASKNISEIYRYDISATNRYYGISRDANGATAFDYFDNNATVGDYIVFGFDSGIWDTLTINVGTALVADAITVVWEYTKQTDEKTNTFTWTTLSVTDSSNTFRNTGVQTITFTPPALWGCQAEGAGTWQGIGGATGNYGGWKIRCRITDVTNITEGGANATNKPTCNDRTILVTGTGNTLDTIYNADVAGSWGVVTKNDSHYKILANLQIGDFTTTTDFTITNQLVDIGDSSNLVLWRETANATITIGVDDGTSIYDGAFIKYHTCGNVFVSSNLGVAGNNYSRWDSLYIYNSRFWKSYGGFNNFQISTDYEIKNSILAETYLFASGSTTSVLDNVIFEGANATTIYQYLYANSIYKDLKIARGIGYFVGAPTTISNCEIPNGKYVRITNSGAFPILLNFDWYDITTQITHNSSNTRAYVKYTVDITVLDNAGNELTDFQVKIIDSQGTTLFDNTWSTPQDFMTYASYYLSPTTYQTDHNPFEIWVSKAGYATEYQKIRIDNTNRNLTVTLGQKIGYAYAY